MRREERNVHEMISRMLSREDKILFNLFYLIAESDSSFWMTDDSCCIIGQTNEKLPMWIWIGDDPDDCVKEEIRAVLRERLTLNPGLKITANEEKIRDILAQISLETGIPYKAQVPMNIYSCKSVKNAKKASGHMILSNETHKDILRSFITGMVHDLEQRPMQDGEAEGFAESVAGSEDLFLWEDAGKVVSMAMVVHRTEEFARINTVYTDFRERGKGYAGMLVGEVTQKILDEGRIPMLYTEEDNICSNAAYKRVGYDMDGKLTQFCFMGTCD